MDNEKTNPFITKLYSILDNKTHVDIIKWRSENSFIVLDESRFCSEVLSKYFKTNSFKSFIRQLNKYDFKKIRGECSFKHPLFKKGNRKNMQQIVPKGVHSTFRELKRNKLSISLFNCRVVRSLDRLATIVEKLEELIFASVPQCTRVLMFENFNCLEIVKALQQRGVSVDQVFFYNDFESKMQSGEFKYLVIDQLFYEVFKRIGTEQNKTKIIVTWENEKLPNQSNVLASIKKPYDYEKIQELISMAQDQYHVGRNFKSSV